MTTNTHIVYRSQREQLFDEMFMDGTLAVVLAATVAFLATVVYVGKRVNSLRRRYKIVREMEGLIVFGSATAIAIAVFKIGFSLIGK